MACPSLQEYAIMADIKPNDITGSPPNRDLTLDIGAANHIEYSDDNTLLSPKSPSSTFSKSTIELSKGCIISSVLLSYWDNIIGPRIRHQWCTEKDANSPLIKTDTLSYVASHTLSGEICRNLSDSNIDTVFCVVKDRDIVLTSFIFGALDKGELAVHSLSLLVPYSNLKPYLNVQELCVEWNTRLVCRLRVLMDKEPFDTVITCFSGYLTKFIQMLNSLREAGIPKHVPLCDTAFHPEHKLKGSLVKRAITSHLMTCGRTVVIGKNSAKINVLLATLAMFLSPQERCRCRYAVDGNHLMYQPDLILQGIVNTSDGSLTCSLQELYLSQYPTSLVDIQTGSVKLSGLTHQHYINKKETITNHLHALWQRNIGADHPTGDMFHISDDPETLVSNFLEELYLLPPLNGVRENYVKQFVNLLERKAVSLLKYVKAEIRHHKGSWQDSMKLIKRDLGLSVPGDFNIILATAEKLKPGISCFLYGQSRTDSEFHKYFEKIK